MPSGQPKDKKLANLRKEVAEFEGHVKKAKDEKEKVFRQEQLNKAKAALAKYLQDKPE